HVQSVSQSVCFACFVHVQHRFSAEPLHKVPLWDALAHMTQLRELLILGWDLEPEDQQGLPKLIHLTQLTVAHSQNNGRHANTQA
ncbi:hypothetical protein DUNSADRAFT_8011, partial [Dunaliella salina]